MRDRKLEGATMREHNLEKSVMTTKDPRTGKSAIMKDRKLDRKLERPRAGKAGTGKSDHDCDRKIKPDTFERYIITTPASRRTSI